MAFSVDIFTVICTKNKIGIFILFVLFYFLGNLFIVFLKPNLYIYNDNDNLNIYIINHTHLIYFIFETWEIVVQSHK